MFGFFAEVFGRDFFLLPLVARAVALVALVEALLPRH